MPPLRHRIGAGQEPYLVFVADAPDGRGDLWAVAPGGGTPIQITFSLPAEYGATLSPDGIQIAFMRSRSEVDTAQRRLAVLNLLNGAERAMPLPEEAGSPLQAVWAPDGRALYVRTTTGLWRLNPPPHAPDGTRVPSDARSSIDSLFAVQVGEPAFARIAQCADATGLCVVSDSGVSVLAPDAIEPVRWGADSVGYLVGQELIVRSLGPGRSRMIQLPTMRNPRSFTYFPGRPRPVDASSP